MLICRHCTDCMEIFQINIYVITIISTTIIIIEKHIIIIYVLKENIHINGAMFVLF